MKANKIYDSVKMFHPEWLREFESWFTSFVLDSDENLDDAAVAAADHCGDWLGKRRPWSNNWVDEDPLAERARAMTPRPRRRIQRGMTKRRAFYETHDMVINLLLKK